MAIELINNIIFYLNAFPWPEGVSQDLSPINIIEGVALDYKLHFQTHGVDMGATSGTGP